jgi:hypothetical protein
MFDLEIASITCCWTAAAAAAVWLLLLLPMLQQLRGASRKQGANFKRLTKMSKNKDGDLCIMDFKATARKKLAIM